MEFLCMHCKLPVSEDDIYLLNGKAIHKTCMSLVKSEDIEFDERIDKLEEEIETITTKRAERARESKKIKNLFNGKLKSEISELGTKAYHLRSALKEFTDKKRDIISQRKSRLFHVYGFWPERPPDWHKRSSLILSEQECCQECGAFETEKHVHHKIPISKGGNHTPHNLIVLCRECHESEHGGRNLSKYRSDFNSKANHESAFQKRYSLLREAANDQVAVKFSYRKYSGERSIRVFYPDSFEKVGTSLCVRGYCTLREDERIFAIRRISRLKIVEE